MAGIRRAAAACVVGAAALSAAAQVPDWSLQAQQRLHGERRQEMAERERLLADGEARLAAGDAPAAEQAFDGAALLLHAADTEIALVRTYMQAGDYRRALAFGAHAAGAHRETPAAAALYVWLLARGGQGVVARHLLDQALAAAPQDPALRWVQTAWAGPGLPTGAAPPLRLAPYATQAMPPADARLAGTAVLWGGGRQALVPTSAIDGAAALWLRNGLGQTVAAELERRDDTLGIALLRLQSPLPTAAAPAASARPPFAGSPAAAVAYTPGAGPAWPLLAQGFFGRLPAQGGARPLGIEMPAGTSGGPVFDAKGGLAGIALGSDGGPPRMVPVQALAALAGSAVAGADTLQAAAPVAVDGLYESALRVALQVIVQR